MLTFIAVILALVYWPLTLLIAAVYFWPVTLGLLIMWLALYTVCVVVKGILDAVRAAYADAKRLLSR